MAIEPKNTREHIISLYGHITGVRKDTDIEKLGGKVDKIYWVLLATVGTVALFVLDKLVG
jgi:hypothetical protein